MVRSLHQSLLESNMSRDGKIILGHQNEVERVYVVGRGRKKKRALEFPWMKQGQCSSL